MNSVKDSTADESDGLVCANGSLEECMEGYCRHRNLCAAATVVELLLGRLREADTDADACVYLGLFRKWSYIAGCHFRKDRFALATPRMRAGQSLPVSQRPSARIIQFRPRQISV